MLTSSIQEPNGHGSPQKSHERLDSWKEVAQFFRREVRTVQMWEKKEGLPIRRQQHSKLGSIFAFRSELEQWWAARSNVNFGNRPGDSSGFVVSPQVSSVGAVRDDTTMSRRVLSLPFELISMQSETGSLRQNVACFGEGLRSELNVELGRLKLHPIVLPTKALPSPGTNSASFLRTITREFEVGFLLCGTISHAGDRVRIIVQLILGSDSRCVWSDRFECDLFSIQSQVPVAARIAEAVASHILRQNPAMLETNNRESRLALNAYGMGLHFWNQRSRITLNKSIGYLHDAVELDPECASAFATLADAYVSMSYHYLMSPAQARSKADEAVRRALVLEPDSIQVRNALINVLLNCHLDRETAEQECRKLLTANAADSRTLELYSIALGARGQHKQAVSRASEALDRAAGSHSALNQLGQANFYAQQFEEARCCMRHAVLLKPQSIMNHGLLGRIEAILGNWDAALAAFEQTALHSDNSPLSQALLAYAYAGAGNSAHANHLLTTLEQHRHHAYYPAYEIAIVHALLHQDQDALNNLARACDLGDMKTIFIAQDPSLRRLRPMSGFHRIALSRRAA